MTGPWTRRIAATAALILAAAALAALYARLQPVPAGSEVQPGSDRSPASQAPQPKPVQRVEPEIVDIGLRGGRRVSGPAVIHAVRGDEVRLQLTSDTDAEIHLHGYDRLIRLHAGVPGVMTLVADRSGRFELEVHGSGGGHHHALAVLEVQPD